MKQVTYQSVVYREGKHFVAQCLNVDVSSFGESEKEALVNLREALELYLEDATDEQINSSVESPIVKSLRLQHA